MNSRLRYIQNWPEQAQQANWSVSVLATRCKVSVRTLERYFLRNMRVPPKVWIREQRQKQAAVLLRKGSTVKEVASQLGYKHANHFSREYKWHWGYSPTAQVNLKMPASAERRV